MRSLLNRQLRKFLPKEYLEDETLQPFLEAVRSSYANFEDQSHMIQRAMMISSEELSEANKRLKKEAGVLRGVINELKKVSSTFSEDDPTPKDNIDEIELDVNQLVNFIKNQTKEIIEVNEQRESLLSNLELKNQELSDYAHMISHDLKSPLRSIDTLMTWFKEDYQHLLDKAGNENLKLISDNVEKMDALISGILNYATISEAEIESYDVDLQKLLDDILNIIYKPQNISIKVLNILPTIKGDKFRLQQLFQNLIDNAIKYNDKEQGIIEIGTFETNPFYYGFYVKDNGKGIDTKYHEKIFQTFQKLDHEGNSTGIGLSIVKKIVNFYNGKIQVESQPGKGSKFSFTLKKQP